MAFGYLTEFSLYFGLLCILCTNCGGEDYLDHLAKRVKRQLPGVGGEACLQIYSVPKTRVLCEPSDEIKDRVEELQASLDKQQGSLDEFHTRLDNMDPEKPRELPDEVKERLAKIDEVMTTQGGHSESLSGLKEEVGRVRDRIGLVETSDREELTRMVEMQTELMQAALRQSNVSIHDAYLDKLAVTTHELTEKLNQLQSELKGNMAHTEIKLQEEVSKVDEDTNHHVQHVREILQMKLSELHSNISAFMDKTRLFQNKTSNNEYEVARLSEELVVLQKHQTRYEEHEKDMKSQQEQLRSELSEEMRLRKEFEEAAQGLQDQVAHLTIGYTRASELLAQCQTDTREIRTELERVALLVNQREHLLPRVLKVADCQDALKFYHPASGVYSINPSATTTPFDVYCQMEDSVGWTVIQRREDGAEDFYRDWKDYRSGFGNVHGEYWLGLNHIHYMTTRRRYRLRVEVQDWDDTWSYAEYEDFRVSDESDNYRLHVSGYLGNAGDSLEYHVGAPFSTRDRNNDQNSGVCAEWCHGAWWYKDCFRSNLNGRYYETGDYVTKSDSGWGDGMVWWHIKNTNHYSLKSSVMKITPNIRKEENSSL